MIFTFLVIEVIQPYTTHGDLGIHLKNLHMLGGSLFFGASLVRRRLRMEVSFVKKIFSEPRRTFRTWRMTALCQKRTQYQVAIQDHLRSNSNTSQHFFVTLGIYGIYHGILWTLGVSPKRIQGFSSRPT